MKIHIISTKNFKPSNIDKDITKEEALKMNNIIAVNDIAEHLGCFYEEEKLGLNILNHYSIICNHKEINDVHLKDLSTRKGKIIALPPETELIVEDGVYETVDNKPFYVFSHGNKIPFNKNINRLYSFVSLDSPEELLNFMNNSIEFGWIDKDNKMHLGNMKNFRTDYKTMTTDEVLERGIGICIEQVALMKRFFDDHLIETKMYCFRKYENKDTAKEEIELHIALFYKLKETWYYIEATGPFNKGITKLKDINDGLKLITKSYEKSKNRKLTEIKDIPSGLSFLEFNKYVNGFKNINFKNIE